MKWQARDMHTNHPPTHMRASRCCWWTNGHIRGLVTQVYRITSFLRLSDWLEVKKVRFNPQKNNTCPSQSNQSNWRIIVAWQKLRKKPDLGRLSGDQPKKCWSRTGISFWFWYLTIQGGKTKKSPQYNIQLKG